MSVFVCVCVCVFLRFVLDAMPGPRNGVIDLTKGAQTKYAGLSQNLRDLRTAKAIAFVGCHIVQLQKPGGRIS